MAKGIHNNDIIYHDIYRNFERNAISQSHLCLLCVLANELHSKCKVVERESSHNCTKAMTTG